MKFYMSLPPQPGFSLTCLKIPNRKEGNLNNGRSRWRSIQNKIQKTSEFHRIIGGIEFTAEAKGHEGSGSLKKGSASAAFF